MDEFSAEAKAQRHAAAEQMVAEFHKAAGPWSAKARTFTMYRRNVPDETHNENQKNGNYILDSRLFLG